VARLVLALAAAFGLAAAGCDRDDADAGRQQGHRQRRGRGQQRARRGATAITATTLASSASTSTSTTTTVPSVAGLATDALQTLEIGRPVDGRPIVAVERGSAGRRPDAGDRFGSERGWSCVGGLLASHGTVTETRCSTRRQSTEGPTAGSVNTKLVGSAS
jgi:hypothetical protein